MSSIEQLKTLGKIVTYKSDDNIFSEGDRSNSIYIILKGNVQIYRDNTYDNTTTVLAELDSGKIFGEMALISHELRSASCKAIDDVLCLEIPSYNFERFISLEPKYAINLLETIAKRKKDTLIKIKEQEVMKNE